MVRRQECHINRPFRASGFKARIVPPLEFLVIQQTQGTKHIKDTGNVKPILPVEGWGGLGVGVRLNLRWEGYQGSFFQL